MNATDDRLQGILFSKSETLDLSPKTPRKRLLSRVNSVKRSLAGWKNAMQIAGSSSRHDQITYYVIPKNLSNKQYQTEMTELLKRFSAKEED